VQGAAVQIFGLSEDNARASWNWQFLPDLTDLPNLPNLPATRNC
jgi:hypothetical protein